MTVLYRTGRHRLTMSRYTYVYLFIYGYDVQHAFELDGSCRSQSNYSVGLCPCEPVCSEPYLGIELLFLLTDFVFRYYYEHCELYLLNST